MDNITCLHQLLCRFQSADEAAVAFSVYDGEKTQDITYRQFLADILTAAGYFRDQNICGRHVAIAAATGYRWIVLFFAVAASGNVVVPLNPELPGDLMQWQCRKADISLLCHDDPRTADKAGDIPGIPFDAIGADVPLSVEEVYSHAEGETLLMMFTSGTTGKSKTVMLSSGNLFASVNNMIGIHRKRAAMGEREKYILSLPLYHIGSVRSMLIQLVQGEEIAVGRGAKYLFMDLPKLNPTRVDMVPAIAESLVKIIRRTPREKWANYVGHNFKGIVAVGAAMKSSVSRYLLDQGVQIEVIFGMTESAGDGTLCEMDPEHIGSIGKPLGDVSFRIEEGEILIRSDGVMKGYYKDPEETARVIADGWLHTGDMGYCDEAGYYYITGRKKNVIILSNGENVNPEEIEAVFSECEAVDECMVYSDGKGICADVFANDRDAAAAYIKQYNERMPLYRQVYKVNYTTEPMPKTGSGKLRRKENT